MPLRSIGVFDSGVGGLTVAAALRRRLPSEHLIYLGDLARLPYGTKSAATVERYALQAGKFLAGFDIKMLVVACNTASAHGLAALRAAHPDLPILGVVEAGAEAAARLTKTGGIVVAATEGTCAAEAFPKSLYARRSDIRVLQIPCPLFVALAEEGITEGPLADTVIRHYLAAAFGDHDNDTLVLGCTHFPLLTNALRTALGTKPAFADCAAAVADQAAEVLSVHRLAAPDRSGMLRLLATDSAARFRTLAERLVPDLAGEVERVDL